MKKALTILTVLFLCFAAFSSCAGGEPESAPEPVETSAEETSAEPEESSRPKKAENNSGTTVKYSAYSEKPYFAVIGTCADGAVVHGETTDGARVDSQSWHGWYSLRIKGDSLPVKVNIWQTVDGEDSEPYTYSLRPRTPDSGTGVVTGKNTQFFYQKALPDFQHTNLITENAINNIAEKVASRLEDLRKVNENCEIIYMIVPSAATAYPENVPDEYAQEPGVSRMDQFLEAVRRGGAYAIDLREVFEPHKYDEMPLFQHFDSHWTDYGAYLAYVALFEHISERFPAAAPLPVDAFDWNPDYYQSGDMPMYLSLPPEEIMDYGYYRKFAVDAPQQITEVVRYRRENNLVYSEAVTKQNYFDTGRPELPDCVVFRDSFGAQIYDIIAERMNITSYRGMWNYAWMKEEIAAVKPDYVIILVAEWNLTTLMGT
ncbi:MAG: hypothetical protein IKX92_01835 [Clostridia bacterium]|nr:hypothetical protein [Clostridia bacterium]